MWAWTGWKGTKTIALADWHLLDNAPMRCVICGIPIQGGDEIVLHFNRFTVEHYTCLHPTNPPDTLQAQWLAIKRTGGLCPRFIESNCAVMPVAEIPAMEYVKGADFPVVLSDRAITENTPEDVREEAKALGLERLKLLIDQIEEGNHG